MKNPLYWTVAVFLGVLIATSTRGANVLPLSKAQRVEGLRRHLEAEQSRSDLLKEALCQDQISPACREISDLDVSLKEYRGDLDDLSAPGHSSRDSSVEPRVRSGLSHLSARLDHIIQREVPLEAE